jgi:YhcH/YjgK/YiaL family protein
MVWDSIENAHLYYNLSPGIETALKFLESTDFGNAEEGRIDIDGDNIYALIQKYNTKPEEEGKWETHRKYIDVQFVARGSESICVVNVNYLDVVQEYSPEKDVEFYDGDGDFIQMNEDEFVILFSHDAHMPGIEVEESEEVLKVVIKVLNQ